MSFTGNNNKRNFGTCCFIAKIISGKHISLENECLVLMREKIEYNNIFSPFPDLLIRTARRISVERLVSLTLPSSSFSFSLWETKIADEKDYHKLKHLCHLHHHPSVDLLSRLFFLLQKQCHVWLFPLPDSQESGIEWSNQLDMRLKSHIILVTR